MTEFFAPDLGNLTATAILGWYAWLASLDSIDSLILGGLNYDQGGPIEGPYAIQDRFKGYIAAALVYGGQSVGGGLTDAANLAVENWARQVANV